MPSAMCIVIRFEQVHFRLADVAILWCTMITTTSGKQNNIGIWCSTIPHLPGCFCPWTENIGFNTVLMDPFMSHLATQLEYSAGEFQALQLIVLAAFGVVD